MVDRKKLNEQELKAISYFAVGVASEGTDREKDVAARLSFAGNIVNGIMDPKGQSGLSIGTLQKDLGQDRQATANALVDAYQAWADQSTTWPVLGDADVVASVAALSRNGEAIRDQDGRDIDPSLRTQLNAFLASKGGRDFVHARDVVQVEHIHAHALSEMAKSTVYENATVDEQIILATIVAKAFNQNQAAGKGLFRAMNAGQAGTRSLHDLDGVLAYAEANHKKYLASGREHALAGAKVLTRLRNADENSPVGRAWREVLADPLVRPTEIGTDPDRPDLAAHYTLIKNLFHTPKQAIAFLDALEQGRHHHYQGKSVDTGFYTDGTNIVQWNADGKGVTFIDGQWAAVSRSDMVLAHQVDGTIEVARQVDGVPQPLLRVTAAAPTVAHALRPGAHGEDVRQLQDELSRLGYTDARGRPLHPDGHYGAGTQLAVQAFQRDHGLAADGLCGQATRAGVQHALARGEATIGVAEAAYRQPTEAMTTYRAVAPVPAPAEALLAPVAPPLAREQDTLPANDAPTAEAVRALQHNLNALGLPDADGRPLITHGDFDPATREAVARFQAAHAMPVTGQADEALHATVRTEAFMAGLRRDPPSMAPDVAHPAVAHAPVADRTMATAMPERSSPAVEATAPSPAATTAPQRTGPRHPDHPQNDLYEVLKGQLPDASERRLLQSTAACHRSRITADNLSLVHINEEKMTLHFFGTGPLTSPASVDLNRPSPAPEESVERMAQFDQQQTQMLAEFRAQSAQMAHGHSR